MIYPVLRSRSGLATREFDYPIGQSATSIGVTFGTNAAHGYVRWATLHRSAAGGQFLSLMSAAQLAQSVREFLTGCPHGVVREDGALLFDLDTTRYSVTAEHDKCLLHLWSPERNAVRRVMQAETANGSLRLGVLRFGQTKPVKLEICRSRDFRSPAAKKSCRRAYLALLQRVLERENPGYSVDRLRSAMDLEHSFGPIYARGLLKKGAESWAVFGVNEEELQGSVDAALTFAVLWLDYCRQSSERTHCAGLKLFLPAGASATTRERMANLDRAAARWELYELDERDGELKTVDCHDRGNIATRLVQCPEREAVLHRFGEAVARIRQIVPDVEGVVLSAAEVAFRLHGLEFARARLTSGEGFRHGREIVFGLGASETVLDAANEQEFLELLHAVEAARHSGGQHRDALYRIAPERWLESEVLRDVMGVDSRLDTACVYSQVPAFSASDRAMIDVLAVTRQGRLAVLELKADEDIHLPLQGLDYWSRVCWHQQRGEFQRFGYFPGHELSQEPPLLLLVAPALHVHPATDTLLRYISPEIDCELVGVDEWGYPVVSGGAVPASLVEQARGAARACPRRALHVMAGD